MKAYKWRGGTARLIHNLITRWSWVISLRRQLRGPQVWSGQVTIWTPDCPARSLVAIGSALWRLRNNTGW